MIASAHSPGPRWVARALTIGGLAILVFLGKKAYRDYAFIPFVPFCHDTLGFDIKDRYVEISTPMTAEFVGAIAAETYAHGQYGLKVHRGRLYQPLAIWLPHQPIADILFDIKYPEEFVPLLLTRGAAVRIYRSRLASGELSPDVLADYTIKVRSVDDRPPRQMRPYECGLMEELAVAGGRFAEPPQRR